MGKEIERKFLVNKINLNKAIYSTTIEQGYLCEDVEKTVRVRSESGVGCVITIKGVTKNVTRDEFEYKIPCTDAKKLLKMCRKTILKKRYTFRYNQKYWYVDVFEGDNKGLIVAEIELKSETEKFSSPPWVSYEVSNEPKYYNVNLIQNPYKNWSVEEILIDDLDISVRCYHALKNKKIFTLNQLSNYTPTQLNLEKKTMKEIEFEMEKHGISWKL